MPDELTIITNNHERDVIYGYELTAAEREQFDYRDFEDPDYLGEFVRYKGWLYDLGDMMPANLPGWDMIVNETFFSGVLFRYARENVGNPYHAESIDSEHVICGRYYA